MIKIDGLHGEGGGQVLRTALSMSALLKVPFTMWNIRAGRRKPGLAPQHLTCVRAVAEVCGARVTGDELGSQKITFEPGDIHAGRFEFDVAEVKPSAGSTSLVLQTVLPPLLFASGPSEVAIRGGTNVPWSPTFEYVANVFLPALRELGVDTEIERGKGGWYPKGGGEIIVRVRPFAHPLRLINWTKQGPLQDLRLVSTVSSGLPEHIVQRQVTGAQNRLPVLPVQAASIRLRVTGGPGTAVLVAGRFRVGIGGFSALGEKGKPAEQVGAEAAAEFRQFLESGAAVDKHLADQLLIYLAITEGTSKFTTPAITEHLRTNAWIIRQFWPVEIEFGQGPKQVPVVRVHGTTLPR